MEDYFRKFNEDLDIVSWNDVARDFAYNRLCYVDPSLDIVKVAVAMALDDKQKIGQWLAQGNFRLADGNDAKKLAESQNVKLQVLVVSPFVLVRPQSQPSIT